MITVGIIYMLMSLMCIRAIAGGSENDLQVHLISKADAEEAKKQLEEAGATVEIK